MKLWPRRSRLESQTPSPNYTTIAVLEYDLFGIQPQPGTAAAAIIGMRNFQVCLTRRPLYIGPEFGSAAVARPSPFLLEPGERIRPLR